MLVLRAIFAASVAMCSVSAQNAPLTADNLPALDEPTSDATPDKVLLYVGTYSRDEGWLNGQGKGVHVFEMDTMDGSLTAKGFTAVGNNPTFVSGTNDKNRRMIYAVNEVEEQSTDKPGTTTAHVYALSADETGALTVVNRQETGGWGAVHVSVSPKEDYVAVSNFGAGSVRLFPLSTNGSLLPGSDFIQYVGGSNAVPARQNAPHPHSMTWVGGESSGVFVADLGNDRIGQYDAKDGKLVPNPAGEFVKRPAGSGPRHMVVHPHGNFFYAVDEISNTVGVHPLDSATGAIGEAIQQITTFPEDFKETNNAADIHMTSCGSYLYASNRGHDSIAMYKVGEDGKLTSLGYEKTRGKIPRNFLVYKKFLLAAHQTTNDIHVFTIDFKTGLLNYTGKSTECGTPVSLFIPRY
ncbi:hypothetical protein Poli38472_008763 [Pythium oligandrum]|uniref:6-phosphogluconolactonase n=1 Tax=Pythium oligandrum TaxID=41045 RepID=A0A8K1FAC6_PYTOL|nr:hypothetical protein Poli38472_008763 [Pythium oligandrum]|eukprot:TMW56115.1 hypothetical protein Poli38472_008763 [Pythium oligandrum]